EAMVELPQLEIAAVMDESGRLVAESTGSLRGRLAMDTGFARVAQLTENPASPEINRKEDALTVLSAHPLRIRDNGPGWALLEFDRTDSIRAAEEDALNQLHWMASAMALLGFVLWSVLHFGFADRLARLAYSVRAFGEGTPDVPAVPQGSDEVGELGAAFTTMAAQLRERDAQQMRLEREVLEISERERRRIGHALHHGLVQTPPRT